MESVKSSKKGFTVKLIVVIAFLAILYLFRNTTWVQLTSIGAFGSYLIYDELASHGAKEFALRVIILFLVLEAITISIFMRW